MLLNTLGAACEERDSCCEPFLITASVDGASDKDKKVYERVITKGSNVESLSPRKSCSSRRSTHIEDSLLARVKIVLPTRKVMNLAVLRLLLTRIQKKQVDVDSYPGRCINCARIQ